MSAQITQIILEIAPSVITILTMIGVIAKVIANFKSLKTEVRDLKCIDDLKKQNSDLMKENYEIKKLTKELLTKIDHVERK